MIHAQAFVSESSVGEGTAVWQFASLIRGSRVGKGCSIGSCSVVDGAIVGDFSCVGHGAQVHPGTVVFSQVFIGPGAIICNDRWPRTSKTGFEFDRLKERPTVVIEEGASIGAGAIILPGVRIGKGGMVAAGVVCGVDVPAGMLLRRDGTLEPMPDDLGTSKRMTWAR